MKKYSDKHLESVPAEFIFGLEYMLKEHTDCPAWNYIDGNLDFVNNRFKRPPDSDDCDICPVMFGYINVSILCPCYWWGEKRAKKNARNLISQWRKWAGIREGE